MIVTLFDVEHQWNRASRAFPTEEAFAVLDGLSRGKADTNQSAKKHQSAAKTYGGIDII